LINTNYQLTTMRTANINAHQANRPSFGLGRASTLLCASFVMLGCSQLLGVSQQQVKAQSTATPMPITSQSHNSIEQQAPLENQHASEKLKFTHHLPPAIADEPLLAGIRAEDIIMAKALAKRNHQLSWKTIGLRSRFVRARLLATLQRLNAPTSLQVIPAVESTYDSYALSQAGALGLWQLMPRTARSLGVHSGKKINGRRHIRESTTAAVLYLQQMHQRFNSWPLALAAYNMGPYAVHKRIKKQPWKAADGLENMPIPTQTRAYVQHVIGLIALLRDNTFSFPEPVQTRRLELPAPIDIERLAQLGGMAEHDIFRFNPCLNQAQYLYQPISIHVPEPLHQSMHDNIHLAGLVYIDKVIKAGDNLWDIAQVHRTSVQILKNINPSMGKYLRIGQSIKVPVNKLAQATPDHNPLLSDGRRIRYKVRSGDSLWRIANRFGTTVKAIARSNQISMQRIIRAGDMLWVLAKVRPS